MDAVLVMSVSIIFDYHVSLNLANILHDFVSHDAHRYYYILFCFAQFLCLITMWLSMEFRLIDSIAYFSMRLSRIID